MGSLTTAEFCDTIQAAVVQHSITYSRALSVSIRWANDDSGAHQDTARFQAILRLFQLPPAEEIVFQAEDTTVGWTLLGKIRQLFATAKSDTSGRTLVIIHYAGHGMEHGGKFHLVDRRVDATTCDAMRFMLDLASNEEYDLRDATNVDILFVLDCCYSFMATREPSTSGRIVEIMAATDKDNPRTVTPPANTFTNKILGEVSRRRRDGHKYIEIANLLETLRAQGTGVISPTHCLKMGAASICIPLTGLTTVDPATIPPSLRAVFRVHLAGNMSKSDVEKFTDWLRSLPVSVEVTLEGIFPTGSMCVRYLVVRLFRVHEIGRHERLKTGGSVALHKPSPPWKENVPFSKK